VRRILLAADTLEAQLAAEVAAVAYDDARAGRGDLALAAQHARETAAAFAALALRDARHGGLLVGDDAADTLISSVGRRRVMA
jgi:hypothetical protein